jgi:hypothetical protein
MEKLSGSGSDREPLAAETPADLPARQFGWWDMFVRPDADPREDGDSPVGEHETLVR